MVHATHSYFLFGPEQCNLIVRCDGFSVNVPNISVVMQCCNLGSLFGVLATKTLNFSQRLGIAADACGAVAHMHRLKFLHRDIKSLNYFISDSNRRQLVGCRDPVEYDDTVSAQCVLGDFGETGGCSGFVLVFVFCV